MPRLVWECAPARRRRERESSRLKGEEGEHKQEPGVLGGGLAGLAGGHEGRRRATELGRDWREDQLGTGWEGSGGSFKARGERERDREAGVGDFSEVPRRPGSALTIASPTSCCRRCGACCTCLFALCSLILPACPRPFQMSSLSNCLPTYLEMMHRDLPRIRTLLCTAPSMMRLERGLGGGEKYTVLVQWDHVPSVARTCDLWGSRLRGEQQSPAFAGWIGRGGLARGSSDRRYRVVAGAPWKGDKR